MKMLRVGAALFHAKRRTNITNVIFAFRDFANVPNIGNTTITTNNNNNNNNDDDDRRRRRKFYSFRNYCKLPKNRLIFQRKINTNNPLKNILALENFWKGTYIYIATLNMVQ